MERIDFNAGWTCDSEAVALPHDAMVHAARRADAPSTGAGAYFEGGVYEYRKAFEAPATWTGKRVLLQFEGVYRKSRVSVNGTEVGGCAYGYVPFFCDVTGVLRFGEKNVVEVVAHNEDQPSSRWYSGGGIYRPAWLWVCEKGGLAPEGVQVSTVSVEPARIAVKAPTGAKVEVVDAEGAVVAAGGPGELAVPDARLWSAEDPYLYRCRVSLGDDAWEERFGIRRVEVRPGKGLFVNGRETLLRGGCIHHDNGILGAATFREAEYRRAKKLKEAGYNALRMSHNPASPAMLDACDELGIYVMDEMWDMWYSGKNVCDYSRDFMENWGADVEATVARDFNHPSVIMYSIGNEVSEPAAPRGVELARGIVEKLHGLDATRPVTGGMNLMIISRAAKGNAVYAEDGSGRDDSNEKAARGMSSLMFNMITNMVGSGMNKGANGKKADEVTTPVLDALDIAGYNYASGRYPLEGKAHPGRVIFGSETFPQDLPRNWAMVKKYPYLVGDFMWTAWDYLGEAGGCVERNADCALAASVEGGELLAFGSANPRTEERFDAGRCTTYYGQAQAVVRVSDPAALKFSVR